MIKYIGESTTASATYAGFSERNLEDGCHGSIVVFGAPADSTLPRQSGCYTTGNYERSGLLF